MNLTKLVFVGLTYAGQTYFSCGTNSGIIRGEGPTKKFFVGPFQRFRRANFARRAKSRRQKFAPKSIFVRQFLAYRSICRVLPHRQYLYIY